MKQNKGLFVRQDNNNTLSVVTRETLLSPDYVMQVQCDWWNRCWMAQRKTYILLSRYDDGDHYLPHDDISFFTSLIWLYDEPKPFTGGDLIFSDYDYKIECKNNTGVCFLGPMRHEVTKVKGSGRFTITMFTDNIVKQQ